MLGPNGDPHESTFSAYSVDKKLTEKAAIFCTYCWKPSKDRFLSAAEVKGVVKVKFPTGDLEVAFVKAHLGERSRGLAEPGTHSKNDQEAEWTAFACSCVKHDRVFGLFCFLSLVT
jgi:hypothetical protein